jgi:hypothetical protein
LVSSSRRIKNQNNNKDKTVKKTLFLAAVPLLVVAFYKAPEVTAQSCATMEIPPVCQNGNRITINNDSKNVSPPNLCVGPGETITVNVVPNGTSARIGPKSGDWPVGSGTSFPLTAPDSGTHDYNVYFEDGSCLDPRIRVRR